MARKTPQGDHSGTDPLGVVDPYAHPDPRLDSLEERLRVVEHGEAQRTGSVRRGSSRGYAQGNRLLATMIASLGGCMALGWLADRWLGTSPWGFLGMMLVGIVLALVSVLRIAGERPE